MGKRRRNPTCHETTDQYGSVGNSQDRDEAFVSSAGGGFRGGGTAGVSRGARGNITYERRLPKFLQLYAHLVETKKRSNAPTVEADLTDDETQDALNRALEENPALEKELNESVVKKAKASVEKDNGNASYSKGDYQAAIKSFSKCIDLDPLNEVYYSNRSAAYCALKEYEKALGDAESVIRMKPRWVKGWARLAVAHFGLEQYSHAKEAYSHALELEPDDQTLTEGRNKAEKLEREQIKESKHTFHKTRKKHKKSAVPAKASAVKGVQLCCEEEEETS